jgi:hypothetical protein
MFLRVLVAAWSLYLLSLVLLFLFPRFTINCLLFGHGRAIGYGLGVLLVVSWAYRQGRLYRKGISTAGKR